MGAVGGGHPPAAHGPPPGHLSAKGHALPDVVTPSAFVRQPIPTSSSAQAAAAGATLPYNVESGLPKAPPPMDPA
jgi:hypothetical protein